MNLTESTSILCQSITDLVNALAEGSQSDYNHIFRSIEIPKWVFENHCFWSTTSYTRNCIFENEKFELILLCWEKGQITPIHDHGGEECWVKIIEGEFRENIYQTNESGELEIVESIISKANDISYMIDFMGYHSLENLSNDRSLSLHLYAKPIRNCRIFDEKLNHFINKDLVYSSVYGQMEI